MQFDKHDLYTIHCSLNHAANGYLKQAESSCYTEQVRACGRRLYEENRRVYAKLQLVSRALGEKEAAKI